MKIRVNVALEYGLLFLYDPYGEPEIPEDTGAAPITATSSCICFQVAAYIDGDADVTLSDLPIGSDIPPTFSRALEAPNKRIALADVPANYYCILPLKDQLATIIIWNWEEDGSERTWVQVQNLDLF